MFVNQRKWGAVRLPLLGQGKRISEGLESPRSVTVLEEDVGQSVQKAKSTRVGSGPRGGIGGGETNFEYGERSGLEDWD